MLVTAAGDRAMGLFDFRNTVSGTDRGECSGAELNVTSLTLMLKMEAIWPCELRAPCGQLKVFVYSPTREGTVSPPEDTALRI